ncbi:hypothetical protein BHF69_05410 [Anaerostipes sp. 992a]|uniref:glycosyltransferase n=1 Tax=Anaerostipes sp. 992a TaxID=1261637 RepID=UPI0009519E8C|nr:glycosyltransferase [Anaerostipes sp. 992a]OLR62168.1 hypothetical protein BHF69_05410 [Anaerostipes sp. 992a]
MKKILIMTNTLYSGGAERVLQTVLNHLDNDKYDITLYSMHRENIDREVYKRQFRYKVVFDDYNGNNTIFRLLSRVILKIKGKIFNCCPAKVFYSLFIHGKYDVEIAFIEGESTKIISGSTNTHSKKLAWVHIDLEKNSWTSFLYKNDEDEKKHYDAFDKIICVSDATRLAFLRKYCVEEKKVITHYNPIDTQYILAKSKEQSLCFDSGVLHIMSVGRLVEQKGFDRLLKAVARLKQNNRAFQLHIIGDGEQKEELQQYIIQFKLERYVKLHGYLANPYAVMKLGDVLICSSRAEGYSLAIAEGMVLGLAIVTTDCSGPNELIGGGKYGLLTENSEEGIYKGLKEITENSNVLSKYKVLALKRSKMFNVQNNIQVLEKIIDE